MMTGLTGLQLLLALMFHFPHSPSSECLVQRRATIVSAIEESIKHYPNLDPEVLVAVGFSETHLGCDRNEGGNWGAPLSPQQRHVPGTPLQAAGILWRSYVICGTWESAARRFRTGNCSPTPIGSSYAGRVMNLSRQIRNIALQNRETEFLISTSETLNVTSYQIPPSNQTGMVCLNKETNSVAALDRDY